jgi:hypothetical protein
MLLDYILKCKISEQGVQIHDFDKWILHRFPLHMYARVHALKQTWMNQTDEK